MTTLPPTSFISPAKDGHKHSAATALNDRAEAAPLLPFSNVMADQLPATEATAGPGVALLSAQPLADSGELAGEFVADLGLTSAAEDGGKILPEERQNLPLFGGAAQVNLASGAIAQATGEGSDASVKRRIPETPLTVKSGAVEAPPLGGGELSSAAARSGGGSALLWKVAPAAAPVEGAAVSAGATNRGAEGDGPLLAFGAAARGVDAAVSASAQAAVLTPAPSQLDVAASETRLDAGELTDVARQLGARPMAGAEKANALQLTISQHAIDDPGWSQALGARLQWMASRGVQSATLRLHPEELGGINVQLSMNGDRAAVQFQTQRSETSELLERLMPRLSQAMEQQGLRLDDAKVSHHTAWSEAQQQNQQFADRNQQFFARLQRPDVALSDSEPEMVRSSERRDSGDSSVDAYA